jgi:hypothetical protein
MPIGVNMPKARAIHLTEIRRSRNAELVNEDIAMLKAIEAGDASEQATVATKKQTLRDIPTSFSLDGYADPDSLKAAWPSELPARE